MTMLRLIETEEPAELLERGARRTKAVGRMAAIAIADADRAKQHLLRRHFDEWADDAMHACPGFLRASIETVTARQIHQSVDVTAAAHCPGPSRRSMAMNSATGALKNS